MPGDTPLTVPHIPQAGPSPTLNNSKTSKSKQTVRQVYGAGPLRSWVLMAAAAALANPPWQAVRSVLAATSDCTRQARRQA